MATTTTYAVCACCGDFPCCLPCQDNPPPDLTVAFGGLGADDIQGTFTLPWNGVDGWEADLVSTGGACNGLTSHLKVWCGMFEVWVPFCSPTFPAAWFWHLTAVDEGACEFGPVGQSCSGGVTCGDTVGAGWNFYVVVGAQTGICCDTNGFRIVATGPTSGNCP